MGHKKVEEVIFVYYEGPAGYAELAAIFFNEDVYQDAFAGLVQSAKKNGFEIVTESMYPVKEMQDRLEKEL